MTRLRCRDPLALVASERRARLAAGLPVFVSLNPVEYHGPHLSVRNDGLVAWRLGEAAFARLREVNLAWDELLWTEIGVGADAVEHPGSVRVGYDDFRRLVLGVCDALIGMGARRVVLLSFHGALRHNLALQAGVDALRSAGVRAVSPMACLLAALVDPPAELLRPVLETVADSGLRAAVEAAVAYDFHAGFLETSMALHYVPEAVEDHERVPPCPRVAPEPARLAASRVAARLGRDRAAAALAASARAAGWFALRPFPGYASVPSAANALAGARLAKLIEEGFVAAVLDAFEGRVPEGEWLVRLAARLSLGGRLT
jgi:creatinine amidohydrolase